MFLNRYTEAQRLANRHSSCLYWLSIPFASIKTSALCPNDKIILLILVKIFRSEMRGNQESVSQDIFLY
ncbi:hypothetical protein EDWATA_01315 [Edwardsiella tarda ATCC 23685]|uniref:Uncharacterized protein n=1 Tax=Edwardsiella tarda ATCC 23685 TaxID=500638 RepID=D4F3K5_EDWTA|nr:hypothetical protein EDWATA_01315 [Edwardsiella tarda ATCC 23685]